MADGNFVYLTRERIVEIEKELLEMKTHGRKSMAEKIAEARSHGDLSENAEYDAAKEEQGLFELKIAKMEVMMGKTYSDLSSGLYIYMIQVVNENNIPVFTDSEKMILLK